mgnify:CR=1 FL=1
MENNKNILPVIIISIAIILSAFFISKTGIYIKNTGGAESGGKISNTISVDGNGKVSARPDMVQLNIAFSETATTSKAALDKVNQKIDSALKVLKDNGIIDSDITTNNLSVYAEYDYNSQTRKIIGQRASQNLEVKIKKIDAKATKATKIIDELSLIDGLQINNISFDIEDKTEFFTRARELAFNKAKQKAEELAKLSKVKLTKPISITDSTYDITPMAYSNEIQYTAMSASSPSSESQISTGEMNVTANISILWGIE